MRPSAIAGSTILACVRRVALALTPLVLVAACGGGDAPVGPSERPAVPTPAAVEARVAAIMALADQPALSVFDFTRPHSSSMARRVGTVVDSALDAALRLSPPRDGAPTLRRAGGGPGLAARGVAGGTVGAAMEWPLTVRDALLGRTYTGYPAWHLDTLATGAPAPGAPANGVRFKLPAVNQSGLVTDPYVADLDLVNTSADGLTGYTATVRTRAGAVVFEHTSLGEIDGATQRERASGYLAHGEDRFVAEQSFDRRGDEGGVWKETGSAPFAGLQYEFRLANTAQDVSTRLQLTLGDDVFAFVIGGTPQADFGAGTLFMNGQALGLATKAGLTAGLTLLSGHPDAELSAFFATMLRVYRDVPAAPLMSMATNDALFWLYWDY